MDYIKMPDTYTIPLMPNRTITFTNVDGKSARIDFGGDEVTFSGDLPMSEAAKMLFHYVFDQKNTSCQPGQCQCCCRTDK